MLKNKIASCADDGRRTAAETSTAASSKGDSLEPLGFTDIIDMVANGMMSPGTAFHHVTKKVILGLNRRVDPGER